MRTQFPVLMWYIISCRKCTCMTPDWLISAVRRRYDACVWRQQTEQIWSVTWRRNGVAKEYWADTCCDTSLPLYIHAVAVTQAALNGARRWRDDRRRPEAETVSLPVEYPAVCDVIRLDHTCMRMTLMVKGPSYLWNIHRMNDLSRAALQVNWPVASGLLARRLQVDDGVEGGSAHHRGLAQVDAHVTHLTT